ncbi:MAG: hypothetical protein ACMXYK_02895 [Candidatus Woesearchaeota archaeon]
MAKFKKKSLNKQQKHHEKMMKRTRNIAILIIVIFAFSMFGIFLQSADFTDSFRVGRFTFVPRQSSIGGTSWHVSRGPFTDVPFYFLPRENYREIFDPSADAVVTILQAPVVYLNFDPNINVTNEPSILQTQNLMLFDISRALSIAGKTPILSVRTAFDNLPVIDCLNATSYASVIDIARSIDTEHPDGLFVDEDNPYCLRLVAPDENLLVNYADMLKFLIVETFDQR